METLQNEVFSFVIITVTVLVLALLTKVIENKYKE